MLCTSWRSSGERRSAAAVAGWVLSTRKLAIGVGSRWKRRMPSATRLPGVSASARLLGAGARDLDHIAGTGRIGAAAVALPVVAARSPRRRPSAGSSWHAQALE